MWNLLPNIFSVKKQRDTSLDMLKGIAISLVIAIHIGIFFLDIHNPHSKTRLALISLDVLSQFAVPLFLFIAGYLENISINRSNISLVEYYKKKLSRILPLYVFFTVFYYMFTHSFGQYSFIDFLSGLVNGTTYAHFWFIPAIISIYLLSPLIMQFKKELGDKRMFFSTLTLIPILALFIPMVSTTMYNTYPATVVLFFILGASYRAEFTNLLSNKRVPTYSILIAFLLSAATIYVWCRTGETFNTRPISIRIVESITMSIAHLIFILNLMYHRQFIERFVDKLRIFQKAGVLSFEIYFLQGYCIIQAKHILDLYQVPIDKFYFYILLFPMAFTLSFVLANILSWLISMISYRPQKT